MNPSLRSLVLLGTLGACNVDTVDTSASAPVEPTVHVQSVEKDEYVRDLMPIRTVTLAEMPQALINRTKLGKDLTASRATFAEMITRRELLNTGGASYVTAEMIRNTLGNSVARDFAYDWLVTGSLLPSVTNEDEASDLLRRVQCIDAYVNIPDLHKIEVDLCEARNDISIESYGCDLNEPSSYFLEHQDEWIKWADKPGFRRSREDIPDSGTNWDNFRDDYCMDRSSAEAFDCSSGFIQEYPEPIQDMGVMDSCGRDEPLQVLRAIYSKNLISLGTAKNLVKKLEVDLSDRRDELTGS